MLRGVKYKGLNMEIDFGFGLIKMPDCVNINYCIVEKIDECNYSIELEHLDGYRPYKKTYTYNIASMGFTG